MDIDALLASQNPDDLRSLALKLLADLEQKTSVLEQQTQKNQTQAQYIQQLEEALKNARQWRFGRKSEAFQGEQRGLFDEDIEAD
ncbi:transposase, partial [Acerihabitans sp. TG2]|uniref:transposase n=1 Tax=Acerihabitans sp. TG2 TaxID=3096008 RepID=UPI002B22273D